MSVLIDGIPMPKDCRDCCFKYESDATDRLVYCYISGCWIIPKDSERAEVCLLKETQPEPHWIQCSETVDIPNHEILACDKYGKEMFGYLAYEDDQWLCVSDNCMMYDPIAWREKPESYRGRR